MDWLRKNYGWRAKKAEWATFGICLLFLAAVVIAIAT